jgi:hypothetical protein
VKIIVWRDKHGDRYYDASTLEAWDRSSIEILKQLTDEPYAYWYEETPYISEEDRELASIDLSGASQSVLATLGQKVQEAKARIQQAEAEALRENALRNEALAIIAAGYSELFERGRRTIPRSWLLLERRTGYEYEEYSLEDVFTGDNAQ